MNVSVRAHEQELVERVHHKSHRPVERSRVDVGNYVVGRVNVRVAGARVADEGDILAQWKGDLDVRGLERCVVSSDLLV